jgi:PAS domain S-box-containing protein
VSIPQLCLAATLAERRKAEEALRASEERYREVIETQTDLICRFLPDTTLTFVNQAYCRFFNRRREELIGLKFVELIPEPERTKSLERIAAMVKAPHVLTVEHQVLLPDGTHGWNQWVNHPVCEPSGRVVEFQAIGRDISDRKRVEEANAKLVHVSRLAMVGELTASIAHEINQPLQAILTNAGAASILLEASPEKIDEVKQILLDIRRDDARASEVIAHIRKLLRKRQLEIHPVQINELITDVVRFVRAEGLRRNVIFETRLQAPLPTVNADPVHVQQVLLNLLLNGLDAITEAPKDKRRLIVTSSLLEPGEVGVSVYDTGRGIAPERLPKLFEPFFTTKPEGMGLGLSISRAIIEVHRGRIWGENNPAGGAAFHFTLPAQGRGPELETATQFSAAG